MLVMTARQCRLTGLFAKPTHGLLVPVVASRLDGRDVLNSCSNALAVVQHQDELRPQSVLSQGLASQ